MKDSIFSYKKLRPWLWRWHRRTGLAAALILIVVTVSGVFLNHTSELTLAKKHVNQAWLLSYYGISEPQLTTFEVAGGWLTGDDKGQLYLNDQPIQACRGVLVGATEFEAGFIAACSQELLLYSPKGEPLEKLSAVYGLPVPVTQLGICKGGQLCIRTPQRIFNIDIEQLAFQPKKNAEPVWSQPVELKGGMRNAINHIYQGQGLDWERVLLDLHSGRLFGSLGVWVFDIAALLLLFLALSGFILWYQQVLRKRGR